MRATVCMLLLLAGLLAGLAEGYSLQGIPPGPATQEEIQLVAGGGALSRESLEDRENVIDSGERGDASFIASEETKEGELWISDDDPDWTPSESQEDNGEDYNYTLEDEYDEDYLNSQENYSREDNDILEGNSREDYESIEGTRPDPGVLPADDGVNAELGQDNGDFGSTAQQDPQDDFSKGPFPVKRRRDVVKTQYQTGQQVVQVPAAYGSEQGTIGSGSLGNIQEGDGGYPGLPTGVEPLFPVEGPSQQEVGSGVEPERVTNDGGKESGGSSIGRWFQEGWRRVTGAVDDLGDRAHATFRNLGDKIQEKYNDLREKVPQLVERFKVLILKFGLVIQEGARYCLRRFNHAVDKARESQVLVKLEQELKEGHAEVAKFFQILGEKVQSWREQHGSANIDTGLTGGQTPGGQTELEEGPHREDLEQGMPDFFQDAQVLLQLNKLADVGVLTQEDVTILTQEHQTQQNQQQDQQNQNQRQDQNQEQNQHQNQDLQNQNQVQQNQNQQNQEQNQHQDQQQNHNSDIQQQKQQDQNSDLQQQNQQQSQQYDPKSIQFPQ